MTVRILVTVFALACLVHARASADDFATSTWNQPPGYTAQPLVASPYAAQPAAGTAYWVERDPRYLRAMPVARSTYQPLTTYRPSNYGPVSSYGASVAPSPTCNGYQPPAPDWQHSVPSYYGASSNYGPLPRGYYKGDGLFGKDTVYAKNQPIRNFFRYLVP